MMNLIRRCALICLQISSHSGEGFFRMPLSVGYPLR